MQIESQLLPSGIRLVLPWSHASNRALLSCAAEVVCPWSGQDGLTPALDWAPPGSLGFNPGGDQSKSEPILSNTFRNSKRTAVLQLHLGIHMYFIR